MAKLSIKVVLDKTKDISEGLWLASSHRVYAGIPATKALREEGDEPSPINNAALMYIHEYGAPEANIPARPVVRPAIKSIRKEIIATLKKISLAALDGNPASVMRGYNILGLLAQNAMRKRITDGPFEPLKPGTLAARRARGRTGTKPLIDTGALRRALTYVIRKI